MKHYKKFTLLLLFLIAGIILSICFGTVAVTLKDILFFLLGKTESTNGLILATVRLPRTVGCIFAGIGLSVSGCLLQIALNNDLAAPNIIGINSGAGFFSLVGLVVFQCTFRIVPLLSFLGAFVTAMVIYFIAHMSNHTKVTVILAGIAITSLLQAGMSAILLSHPTSSIDPSTFLYGTLSGLSMDVLMLPCIIIILVVVFVLFLQRYIHVFLLGDEIAQSLGLNVLLLRFILILCAAILSGCVVSFAGILGFVGLIIPHMAKQLIGQTIKALIPFSMLLGAVLVLACDMIARLIFSPFELPVGIVLSLLGCPYFLYLLIKGKGDNHYA